MRKTDEHTKVIQPVVHRSHVDSLRNNVTISTPSVKILFLLWSLLFIALYHDSARADQLNLHVNQNTVASQNAISSIGDFERTWSGELNYQFKNSGLTWLTLGIQKTAAYATHVPNFNKPPSRSWVIKLDVASKDFW